MSCAFVPVTCTGVRASALLVLLSQSIGTYLRTATCATYAQAQDNRPETLRKSPLLSKSQVATYITPHPVQGLLPERDISSSSALLHRVAHPCDPLVLSRKESDIQNGEASHR